ncbi:MAG: hypothetical protein AAFY71_00755 [Bacteroidota bacterium]
MMNKQKKKLLSVLVLGLAVAAALAVGVSFMELGESIQALQATEAAPTFSVLP